MPYKSEKQRKFMHATMPKLAAKWDKKYGGKLVKTSDKTATKSLIKHGKGHLR